MPSRVEKLPLETGGHILVEVYEIDSNVERVGVADKAARTFEAVWDTIQPVIQTLSKKTAACASNATEIKFGVKFSSDFNAIIASAKGDASFEITLSWKPEN
jgi:hypothetical protein